MRTTPPALAIFMTFLLVSCDSGTPLPEKKTETLARPAKLIEVGQANSNDFLNYPAVIQSRQLSILSFEVGGMLKELMVIEAQQVNKGDVLAKLDQRDLLAKLTSARAQFKNANIEYQRALRLIKQDAISSSKLEERKSKRDVNKSHLETAKKALQDSVLIAPFSGAISKVSIKKRQIIQPGESAITILGKQGLEAKI
ncbi:MAG: efflux RND transporter periplasmic adaptor subunit, partial [Methylococcaceae bacterium]